MSRGEELADQLETASGRFIELVASLTEAQWRQQGANAPGYRFESHEDEARTVGQIALHTAHQHLVQMDIVSGIAAGESFPAPTPSPVRNGEGAAANPDPDRDQVQPCCGRSATGSWRTG